MTSSNNDYEEDEFLSQNPIIFKKFKPLKLIGKGTFSSVYLAENLKTNNQVAIKVEKRINDTTDLLETEAFLLHSLRGFGIPEVISFGKTKNYNILIEPLLGISLLDLYVKKNKKIDIRDICLIAIQLIDRIEWVHSKNIIYRDIKPENFLFGKKNPDILYIIDFGLCRKYINKNGKHISPKNTGKFTGTSRYASIYAMAGNEQSRRDDIESIGYLIIFLMKTRLPWQGIQGNSHKECYQRLYLMKKYMPVEKLCHGLPKEMIDYLKCAKSLKFEQEPNYCYLKHLFKNILSKIMPNPGNYKFSWLIKEIYHSTKKKNTKIVRKNTPIEKFLKSNLNNNDKKKGKSPISQEVGVSLNFFKNLKNLNIGKSTNNINLINQTHKINNNNVIIDLNNTNVNLHNKNLGNTLLTNFNKTVNSYTMEPRKNSLTQRGKISSFCDQIKISPGKNKNKISLNKKLDNIIKEVLTKRKPQFSTTNLEDNNKNSYFSNIKNVINSNVVKNNSKSLDKTDNINFDSTRNLISEKKNRKLNSTNPINNHTFNSTNKKEKNNKFELSSKKTNKSNTNHRTFDSKNDTIRKKINKNRNSSKNNNNYFIVNSNKLHEKNIKNNNGHKMINSNSSAKKNETKKFNSLFVSENNKFRFQILSCDRTRKLNTQNSLCYSKELLKRQRNIYNLNINNPTINININNKNNNFSPKITQSHSLPRTNINSNLKISNSNNNINHKRICIKISNTKKNDKKINKEKKIFRKCKPICTSHNYYNHSDRNTSENLFDSKNNNLSNITNRFGSSTINYSNNSKNHTMNSVMSCVQYFKKDDQIPSIKYAIKKKNTNKNLVEGSKSVYNSLEFGLSEEDERIKKTYEKNKINIDDKNKKIKNLVTNDVSKYSFITKNNSKTFMMNNRDEEKNDKINMKPLVWKVNNNIKEVSYNEGINENKGCRINNYVVNRKKKQNIV